jgi:hypothetical protein
MHTDIIRTVCKDLGNSDWPEKLAGNCIAASDIVQSMLYDQGVDSEIIECTLSVYGRSEKNDPIYGFVGYDKVGGICAQEPNSIDTHVVVVTKTEPPMLIDFGIKHRLPADTRFICDELNSVDPKVISRFQINNLQYTYRIKERIRLPAIHQKSLQQRANESTETNKKISYLNKIVMLALGGAVLNFITNIAILIFNK